MKQLRDKRAIVTGAALGIGRAIALALAREGVNLFLVDVQAEPLAQVVAECRELGVQAMGRVCDLANEQQIQEAAEALLQHWGGLDLLVNNAGITYWGDTHDMTAEHWNAVIAVNLLAPIRLIHALLPALRAQTESHLLNVASITGLVPKRRIAAYQTTKFALVGLGQSLRAEYSAHGLGVTTLCPGFVTTHLLASAEQSGMLRKLPKPSSWHTVSPEYVAMHAVRAIRRNRNVVVIPMIAHFFWLLQRFLPNLLDMQAFLTHHGSRRRHGPHLAIPISDCRAEAEESLSQSAVDIPMDVDKS